MVKIRFSRQNSPTKPKQIRARLLESEAVELRLAGLSFAAIAEKLGRQKETVRKAVLRSLDRMKAEISEKTASLVEQEHLSLRLVESKLAEGVSRGEIRSIEILLAVKSLKYKLLGLGVVNANHNHIHNGAIPLEFVTREQMQNRVKSLLEDHRRAQSLPPPGSPRPVAAAVRAAPPVDDPHDYTPAPAVSRLQPHDQPVRPYAEVKARHRATMHEQHHSIPRN
jgi:DNA-binding CsgD family transcriptional regulator